MKSMKTALIVKEDGKIWVNKVPEEPEYTGDMDIDMGSGRRYAYGIEAAKDSAVLCADQEQAQQIIIDDRLKRGDVPPFKYRGSLVIGLGEGIYPIPDLKFTINAECPTWCSDCEAFDWSTCKDKYLAILTLSEQPKGEESQEELWREIYMDFKYGEGWINFTVRMKSKFTIIRNLKENQ